MNELRILNFLFNKYKYKYTCLDKYKCSWFEDSGFIVCEDCPRRVIYKERIGEIQSGKY